MLAGKDPSDDYPLNGDDAVFAYSDGEEEVADPLIAASLIELEAELATRGLPISAEKLRASMILNSAADHIERARRKTENRDGSFLKIIDELEIDGEMSHQSFFQILLTKDGELPPLERPSSIEQLIVRVPVLQQSLAETGGAAICYVEHRIPKGARKRVKVERFVVTATGIDIWQIHQPSPVRIADEVRVLDEVSYMMENYRLVEQREPKKLADGTRTSLIRPVLDLATEEQLLNEELTDQPTIEEDQPTAETTSLDFNQLFKLLVVDKIADAHALGFVRIREGEIYSCFVLPNAEAEDKSGIELMVKLTQDSYPFDTFEDQSANRENMLRNLFFIQVTEFNQSGEKHDGWLIELDQSGEILEYQHTPFAMPHYHLKDKPGPPPYTDPKIIQALSQRLIFRLEALIPKKIP